MNGDLKIYMVDINRLVPYINNPRKNDKAVDAVAASIKEFGFKVPVTVDKNNVLVTGHTRIKAALKLGIDKVPVIVLDDLNEEQVKAFRLVDNKVSEIAEWDFEALATELADIHGIDMSEFDFELHEEKINELHDDDFDLNQKIQPKAKYGQVWKLGKHRVMCGDATRYEDVEKLMDYGEAKVLLTDPPYNVNYEGTAGTIMNDKQSSSSFLQFLIDAFQNAYDFLSGGGSFYIWHSDSEGYSFRTAANEVGLKIRQCLIWNKNSLVLGRQDYQWKHEPCLYGWKDGGPHYFINDRTFTTVFEDEINVNKLKLSEAKELIKQLLDPKVPTTVINEDKPTRSVEHPTMKPVRLMGRLIANSSHEGDIVLDPFGGSGSTLIACEQLSRICYTMELDPHFVDVIIARYEKLTGDKAVLIDG